MKYLVLVFAILFYVIQAGAQDYIQPNFEELAKHEAPEWYNDAKFGIFIHWGLYSVPAWATPIGEPGDFEWEYYYKNMPYAEWYLNSLKIDGSPTQRHHAETYGEDFDYYEFIPLFNKALKKWNPDEMAGIIKKSGANYAVLTTKHHDGFTLWPSRVENTNFPESQATVSRDVVGELSEAVRKQGLKMGLYYSGGLDWSFNKVPVTHIRHVFTGGPQGADYCAYVDAHYKELINNYKPDILWNDIGYPKAGDLETILGNYFFQVPHGTVNNRWQRKGIYNGDFVTPEYSKLDSITPFKWETCRGIGFSFRYNRLEGPEEYMSGTEIVQLLVDIVSKNGNLLLNIGPKADGTVPAEQKQALQEVGEWLQTNGEGIYGSRPWKRFGTTTADGAEIRFTQKADVIYLFAWNFQDKAVSIPENLLPEFEKVVQIAKSNRIDWKKKDNTITFVLPGDTDKELPVCLKLKK
ncbi:MAG: alpha-L-fucosidase [Prolixibacteraceae bacterium]